jgi:DNA polymerase
MEDSLEKIEKEVAVCRRCPLWKTRQNAVPGEGPADAGIMLVSEAPGASEDRMGRPFVGRAGKILGGLTASAGLKREEVYITNILKCRPPGNRNPKQEEIRACTPYLDRQINIIKPGIICTLGNFATAYILEKFSLPVEPIGRIHGQVFSISNLLLKAKIIPMYHPAAAVYNANMLPVLKDDFRKISSI